MVSDQRLDAPVTDCVVAADATAPAFPVGSGAPNVSQDLFIRCAQCQAQDLAPNIEAVLTLPSREVILWCKRHETAIFKVKGENSAGQGLMLLAVYEGEPT